MTVTRIYQKYIRIQTNMKFFLRLPTCPYCGAVKRYNDVKSTTHDKVIKCHHCKKKYRVSYIKGHAALILIECVILIVINVFLLKQTRGINIPLLAGFNAVIILLSTLLFPFTVRYKKIK